MTTILDDDAQNAAEEEKNETQVEPHTTVDVVWNDWLAL